MLKKSNVPPLACVWHASAISASAHVELPDHAPTSDGLRTAAAPGRPRCVTTADLRDTRLSAEQLHGVIARHISSGSCAWAARTTADGRAELPRGALMAHFAKRDICLLVPVDHHNLALSWERVLA